MNDPTESCKYSISVVVPVSERHDDLAQLLIEYDKALRNFVGQIEYIVVLDGDFVDAKKQIEAAAENGLRIRLITLARSFGESTALAIGFDTAEFELVLTVPAYRQIEPSALGDIIGAIDDNDMIIARRWPRHDSLINRFVTRLFHGVVRWITGYDFRDLGCGVRLLRKQVTEEIRLYGDQHRFLPMLAAHRGFSVKEKSVQQSARESRVRVYGPGTYARRLLDVITVFFLTRFTRKPLRFFGLIGGSLFVVGGLFMAVLTMQRMFFDMDLGNRPALVITTLMLVLGMQLIALGLVGELVIFSHARSEKEYTVAETINLSAQPTSESRQH